MQAIGMTAMAKRTTKKPPVYEPARKSTSGKVAVNKHRGSAAAHDASESRRTGAAATEPRTQTVRIRHYCQGIGDCHLLRFMRDGDRDFFLMIDCGVHSSVSKGSTTMAKVVADVASVTDHINVLVLTHEHWDHLSAFVTAADEFKSITVGDVWLAWTENPHDRQAQQLDKYKGEALQALQLASNRLNQPGFSGQLAAIGQGLQHMLGFYFGATGDKVRGARDAAIALKTGKVIYLEPGAGPLSLPGVDGVNVYVLGPPRDQKLLGVMQRASEMYGLDSAPASRMARALMMGFGSDSDVGAEDEGWDSPFDPEIGVDLQEALKRAAAPSVESECSAVTLLRDRYLGSDPSRSDPYGKPFEATLLDRAWRRIDADWLLASADLAMQLDQRTNNTSLVLAFEFVESRHVLLFAADAQVGNWLSWQDLKWGDKGETTGPDLLKRTVYYKVGHHGSHNATLRENGLELMTSPDLSAFIPVNAEDARKVGWGQMPFKDILVRLDSLTQGRTVRADDGWVKNGPIPSMFDKPAGCIKAVRQQPGLWVELDLG
jgi:hypothetical protein